MYNNSESGFLNPAIPLSRPPFVKRFLLFSVLLLPVVSFGLVAWCNESSLIKYSYVTLAFIILTILIIQLLKRATDLDCPAWHAFIPILNLKLFLADGNHSGSNPKWRPGKSDSTGVRMSGRNNSYKSFNKSTVIDILLFLISLVVSVFYFNNNIEKLNCFQPNDKTKTGQDETEKEETEIDDVSNHLFEYVDYQGKKFSVFSFNDVRDSRDRLKLIQNIQKVKHEKFVSDNGKKGFFLTNAGFFEPDCQPTGYMVSQSIGIKEPNMKSGFGNFYLKPNGVFFVTKDSIGIMDSDDFINHNFQVLNGVQSGPLLLKNSFANPQIQATSDNRRIRVGIGIKENGNVNRVIIAKSQQEISFYEFMQFFKTELGCNYALHLMSSGVVFYHPENEVENSNAANNERLICNYIEFNLNN